MVYINSDGSICQSQPWSLNSVIRLFYGLFSFVILFFKSLVGLDTASVSNTGSRFGGSSSSPSFRGGGGGPGYGPGGGGGGGGPNKRIFTMRDVNPPTIGGCPGGACGR